MTRETDKAPERMIMLVMKPRRGIMIQTRVDCCWLWPYGEMCRVLLACEEPNRPAGIGKTEVKENRNECKRAA